jgi:hypothetical protein
LIHKVHSKWDTLNNKWFNDNKCEYSCDENGNLDEAIEYHWDIEKNLWIALNKEEYSHNENDNLISQYTSYWDNYNSVWDTTWLIEYEYTTNVDFPAIEIDYYWNDALSQWDSSNKIISTYDENSNPIVRIKKDWDNISRQWISDYKNDYSYDVNGNPVLEVYSRWDESTSNWEYIFKNENTYKNGCKFSDLGFPNMHYYHPYYAENKYDIPGEVNFYLYINNEWNISDKATYYYSDNPTTSNYKIPKFDLNLYPNPASEFVIIKSDMDLTTAILEIFDMQGEIVLNMIVSENKQISIYHLTKGYYIYRIINNDIISYGTLLVE